MAPVKPHPRPYDLSTHHNGPSEALVLFLRGAVVGLSHHLQTRGVRSTEVSVPEGDADRGIVLTLVQWRGKQAEGLGPSVLVEDVEVGIATCRKKKGGR